MSPGAVRFVNERFYFIDDPIHCLLSRAVNGAGKGIPVIRAVFAQTVVSRVRTFHADDNDFFVPVIQKIFHTPAFAIGRVRIIKQIVPVEHIHDGIPFFGFIIIVGQINMQPAVLAG